MARKKGQAGVEVTPAMIEAGVAVLLGYDSDGLRHCYEQAVAAVFSAMRDADELSLYPTDQSGERQSL